jgi:carbon monoxide dehydrogenase subunit G
LSLNASGEIRIAAPPEKVFAVLLDPAALAKVIPGCHELLSTGDHSYRADVTVGVGLVKARYAAEIVLSEINAPHSLRLAGQGTSSLGTGAGSGTVRLEATAEGTLLHYDYAAQVGGKVAAVGSRMLEGAARIILAQLFESLGRQATGEAHAAHAAWWLRLKKFWSRTKVKPPLFDYLRAEQADEAAAALAQYGEDARILAGGQSLMAVLNMRLAQPSLLVDISRSAATGRPSHLRGPPVHRRGGDPGQGAGHGQAWPRMFRCWPWPCPIFRTSRSATAEPLPAPSRTPIRRPSFRCACWP